MRFMRLQKWDWLLQMAELTAQRTTCLRRAVGAVLADEQSRVLATGYNGVPRGMPHCNDVKLETVPAFGGAEEKIVYPHACPAATAVSGTQLDGCNAVHAEQNALLQCRDVDRIFGCFVTCSPCLTCVKLLLNTPCQYIVFSLPYAHDQASRELWTSMGRQWWHADKPIGSSPPR